MEKIINILREEGIISREKYNLFVEKYGEARVTIPNLIKVKILNQDEMDKFIFNHVRMQRIRLEDLSNIQGINFIKLLQDIAKDINAEYIDTTGFKVNQALVKRFSLKQLVKFKALPLEENDKNEVIVAFENPFDFQAKEAISRSFYGKIMVVAIVEPSFVRKIINQLQLENQVKELVVDIEEDLNKTGIDIVDDESPAILKLIQTILSFAISQRTSDIHIEATEHHCIVRNRVDGMLIEHFKFGRNIFSPLSSRIKLLSNLDIAEKRRPQDGRFSSTVNNAPFDFRVSTLPTVFGESIVMRILEKSKTMVKLEDAGMSSVSFEKFSKAIASPYGIVLVTGPTGSGKTTTLYGALNAIVDEKDKIITVEDPVEYQMAAIQQVQVNVNAGLTFATALKSILRQDPDKIMIGEIRDQETLRIAIQAALTGHLVLSTLHTNSAIESINRILDMGIEEYLVSGALVAIQAQRLVRKICTNCKTQVEISDGMKRDIAEYLPQNPTFYKGLGCSICNGSGYLGREMISEVLPISGTLSHMIAQRVSNAELYAQAKEEGFVSMFENGVQKALEGKTTVEELFRVTRL